MSTQADLSPNKSSAKPDEKMVESEIAQRWRFRTVSIGLPALLGVLTSISLIFVDLEQSLVELFSLLTFMFLFFSAVSTLRIYLQTGFKGASSAFKGASSAQSASAHIEARPKGTDLSAHIISGSERDALVARLRESIQEAATTEFLGEIRASVEKNQPNLELVDELQKRYQSTTERLNTELETLARRGTVNLLLGISNAILGIGLFGFLVWTMKPSEGVPWIFVENFLPRLSVAIFIEVFAYFFLRLYSTSLLETKYFQNEITNIEAKFLALRTATHLGDKRIVESVILQLAKTERNYILQKGQTTADLERSRAEQETITSLTRSWLRVLPRRPWS